MSIPQTVDRQEFLPASEFRIWIGPYADQSPTGKLTGEFRVACPDCGREASVSDRRRLSHHEDCQLAEVLSR